LQLPPAGGGLLIRKRIRISKAKIQKKNRSRFVNAASAA